MAAVSVKKSVGFMSKTNALHVHHASYYISLTSTARLRRETSQCDVLWRTWTYDDKFSFLYLNMDKVLKNLIPGKVAYIWQIERVQIDAIKFERTQIQLLVMFLLSSLLLKLPNDAVNEKATWSSKNAPLEIKHDFKT